MNRELTSFFRVFISFFFVSNYFLFSDLVIIDSDMTFEEAIFGTTAPSSVIEKLRLVDVEYYSFDSLKHRGQMVIHQDLVEDVKEIFQYILAIRFPVAKVIPIVKYDWSDSLSMADNNSSAFNYRFVSGTKKLSDHSFGRAIDINPVQNPYISSKITSPKSAVYNSKVAGTLTEEHSVVRMFKEKGWKWGGNYKTLKDYHHFYIKR